MQRREFVTLLGSAAAAWPLAASTQERAGPVIGILGSTTAAGQAQRMAIFMQALKEAGFLEGQNVAIEQQWASDQYDRLPDMAADLVRRRVSLIVTMGNNLAARAAKAATTTIPIVFAMGADPLQTGLVTNLPKPGGNVTGVTVFSGDSVQKRMQLLHDLLPGSKVFGFLANPDNLGSNTSDGRTALEQAQDAVRSWGGTLEVAQVRSVSEFDAAFKRLGEKRIDALGSTSDAMFNSGRERLIALAAQYSMPMVHISTEDTRAGGLMSYSASQTDAHRQAGFYAGRILKGEKPADLPVLLPTRFEFAINLKTAKTLGLTVPPGLLAIVDVVIE